MNVNDKLHDVYCIIGNNIWNFFTHDEIGICDGYAFTRITIGETDKRLNDIIKKYGLKL